MDLVDYNRDAWNHQVNEGNQWTQPVTSEIIQAAKQGTWQVLLTQHKPVPRHWFPNMKGLNILALASGGGQQGPVLAAAGADVTVFDNSPNQLKQDDMVAQRDQLTLQTQQGSMTDLSHFQDGQFDLVFNPCSVSFVADVTQVWREAARVLKPGGILMTGFLNPTIHIFDEKAALKGSLEIRHTYPYSDTSSLRAEEVEELINQNEPLMHGHSFTSLFAGQMQAGLALVDLYEDSWDERPTNAYMPGFFATKAIKRS